MNTTLLSTLSCCLTFAVAASAENPTQGKQVEQSLAVSDGGKMPYLIYLPKNYSKSGKKIPLMLFLHGRGESDGPLKRVALWGPPRRLAAGEHMKYIVVSPQCPKESFWSKEDQQKRLFELLTHIKKNYNIDTDRIYLTGLSMGGYGTWQLAANHPTMFAAAAPICGGGKTEGAPQLIKLPIWAWHGTADKVVPVSQSSDMVQAIQAAGGKKIRLTTLEHIGHFSWQAAYQSNDLYAWFDQQKASQNK